MTGKYLLELLFHLLHVRDESVAANDWEDSGESSKNRARRYKIANQHLESYFQIWTTSAYSEKGKVSQGTGIRRNKKIGKEKRCPLHESLS